MLVYQPTLHLSVTYVMLSSIVERMDHTSKKTILDVAHVTSRGKSFRITLPKKIAESLQLDGEDDIVVFFKEDDGSVVLEKMRR